MAAQNLLHRAGQVIEPEGMKDPAKPAKRQLVSLKPGSPDPQSGYPAGLRRWGGRHEK
jgi:hypothetical protein